ncbi:chemotaxis protein CheA [Eubacterium xylanophilum]|uniref:chemotaxis protein CheA n=1 Tax=Eubacterium xylanophilum TaxID=39497 RepID=UPI00047B1F8E|nr:chemotaxis protein CheA [Eubacterium xylanophilum]
MDTSQYLELFIDETKEHLQALNEHILVLEKDPENEDTINEIFRAAHTLKGMSGTMGFTRMQRLTHDLENAFTEIRNGNMKANSKLVDIMFRGLDALEQYLDVISSTGEEGTEDNEDIINDINNIIKEQTGGGADDASTGAKTETKSEDKKTETSVSDLDKYAKIEVNESDILAIEAAKQDGHKIYGVTVYLQESCILKAARAFLVFKNLETKGELIKSVPTIEEIEDEEFDFDFSWIIASKSTAEEIEKAGMSVSEVAQVRVGEFNYSTPAEEEVKEEKPADKSQKEEKSGGEAAPKKTSHGSKGKVASRSVRVDIDKLDVLMNLVSELIIAKNGLISVRGTEEMAAFEGNSVFNENLEYLERITTNLHESVMKVRMVPIETVVNRFPRMIRDLNRKLDKKMELYMSGEDTELDRTVIDELGDPLMHLLRNSADHGLESNEERVKLGKPEVGSIYLDAYQEGNNVTIEVRDDGGGIDIEKIKKKALEKGTITEQQAETMTEKDYIDLLFKPSFSTADKVSDISGRGVGLDVVKTKIEALGGSIDAKTVKGEGSTFTIQLPLTLAIIQALMIVVANEKYAIPLGNIDTIENISPDDIKLVQSKEVINLRGSVIPVVRMREVLCVDEEAEEQEEFIVVVVKKGDQRLGLITDGLIGQQETVIKSMGHYITCEKLFSGATILGDGEVALILDTNTMM